MMRIAIGIAAAVGLIASSAHAANYELAVEGLACPFCAYSLERALMKIGGIEQIDVNIGTGLARVTTEDGVALDRQSAEKAVKTSGFTLQGFEELPAK
jgi:copper chaperone CopZ